MALLSRVMGLACGFAFAFAVGYWLLFVVSGDPILANYLIPWAFVGFALSALWGLYAAKYVELRSMDPGSAWWLCIKVLVVSLCTGGLYGFGILWLLMPK